VDYENELNELFPGASDEALEEAAVTLSHIMKNPFMLLDDAIPELLMRLAVFADAGEPLAQHLLDHNRKEPA
jgi:hypothetical protein